MSRISGPGIDITIVADSSQAVAEIRGVSAETEKYAKSLGKSDQAAQSAQVSAGGLQASLGKLRGALGAVGAAVGVAFGISTVIDRFINRTEDARKKLDEISASARSLATETAASFRAVPADDLARRFEQVSKAAEAAANDAAAKGEASLRATNVGNLLLRQLGLAPSREEIFEEVSRAQKQAALAVKTARIEIDKLDAERNQKRIDDVKKQARAAELALLDPIERSFQTQIDLGKEFDRLRAEAKTQAERDELDRLQRLKIAQIAADRDVAFAQREADEQTDRDRERAIREATEREAANARRIAEQAADAFAKAFEGAQARIAGQAANVGEQLLRELVSNTEGLRNNIDRVNNGVRGGRRI